MPKIRKRWTEENMEEAIRRVREGETAYQVAKDMDIPISTLSAKSTGKLAMNAKLGGKTILTTEEENLIVQWMLNLSSKGFPVTKSNVIANVSALMQKSNRPNPFVNGVPGRKWFSGFLHRHQDISERITHSLGKRRAEITEGDIRGWFASVQTELDKNNLTNIDGERKFNCDETSFSLSASSEPADDKENLAVLFMTNAQGKLAPPLIMFPNKRISYGIKKSVPEGWAVGKSENGWMTGDAFFYYITKVFNPWLIKENIEKPVVLFLDGHKSHTTAPLLEFCATNGIEIVVLFSNATHILQPEEVSLFRNLKRAWSKKVAEWQEKNGKYIRKEDFAPLLQEAISKLDWEKTMKNGFQKTGLHPFNPDAIDYRHLLTANGHPNYEERQAPGTSLLDGLENVIDPDVLEGFRSFEQEGSYQGDLENVGLYDVWRRIKELVASNLFLQISLFSNECQELSIIRYKNQAYLNYFTILIFCFGVNFSHEIISIFNYRTQLLCRIIFECKFFKENFFSHKYVCLYYLYMCECRY